MNWRIASFLDLNRVRTYRMLAVAIGRVNGRNGERKNSFKSAERLADKKRIAHPICCLHACQRGNQMALSTIPAPLLFSVVIALVLATAGLFRRSGLLLVLAAVLVATAAGFAFSAMALA